MKTLISPLGLLLAFTFLSCQDTSKPQFQRLSAQDTGIDFSNTLTFTQEFNVYRYRNYYNGGGVAIGDVNNDGLQDIYLTANQKPNRLFLNQGNFKFKDITASAGVKGNKPWSTGVTFVDINADGLLDIYVCNSGDLEGENKQNELFINNGDLTFTEAAEQYGLEDRGFSTHACFFDYDRDGDLDAYILNNSFQAIGSFDLRRNERGKRDDLGGDKLMENRGGKFYDVSEQAGIYGSIIGFGLGVTVGDVNGDRWEDMYISNDFFERDYLYINQKDGTFKEVLTDQIQSISGASMGADMADINNDGYNDIFVTEMLPDNYERLKSVTTFEDWNKYEYNVKNGYYHQYTRNTFQLNNQNNTFSEIGRFAGVEASDWSWGALFFDMDNDGFKDLFVANGIYQDLTDQDYLQYISNEAFMQTILSQQDVDYSKLIEIIPSNPVPNVAFKNKGALGFDKHPDFGLNTAGFSNGAAYGDLDNDGDLDLIVNNVNQEVFIYRNQIQDRKQGNFIQFQLKGTNQNTQAIGAKIEVRTSSETFVVEQQPTRGFQSSMDFRPHLGLPSAAHVDVTIHWPSGKQTLASNIAPNKSYTFLEEEATLESKNPILPKEEEIFKLQPNPGFKHQENRYVDFHHDRLLYQMCSNEGPHPSLVDWDSDGEKELFIGGSKNQYSQILENPLGDTSSSSKPFLSERKLGEVRDQLFFDADGDGDLDLYIATGSNELSPSAIGLTDQFFRQENGVFVQDPEAHPLSTKPLSVSVVEQLDFNRDGAPDMIVGERFRARTYGIPVSLHLFENNGKGIFTDVTKSIAPEFSSIGMITDLSVNDLDGDQIPEIIAIGEFMGVHIFQWKEGKYRLLNNHPLLDKKGWWNRIHVVDINGDNRLDLLIGNHGLNSRFRADSENPIRLYINDYDSNGSIDPVLCFRAPDGKDYPYALRHDLIDQMKGLKKLFPDYESFKNKSIQDIFSLEQLNSSIIQEVNTLQTSLFINRGAMNFEPVELPSEVQFSSVYALNSGDFDRDGDTDLLLGGNQYMVKPEMGRQDANYGLYIENIGSENFRAFNGKKGFKVTGQIRDFIVDDPHILVVRNNDSLLHFKY